MAKRKLKNKKYNIMVNVPFDLYAIIDIINNEAQSNPEAVAPLMYEFGVGGDWTLEIEYLKTLKRSIKLDYGKKAADLLEELINIMEKPQEDECNNN